MKIALVVVLVLKEKPRTTTRTRTTTNHSHGSWRRAAAWAAPSKGGVLILGSAPPHFPLRGQSAVFPVCKKDLGDMEVFVDLLQAGPDTIELFVRRHFPGGAALQAKTHAFPEKHHDKDGE